MPSTKRFIRSPVSSQESAQRESHEAFNVFTQPGSGTTDWRCRRHVRFPSDCSALLAALKVEPGQELPYRNCGLCYLEIRATRGGEHMRRRDIITGLGSIAVWPLVARAQHQMPVVGFLSSGAPGPFAEMTAAFSQSLSDEGFAAGKTVTIEYRWAEGQYDRLPSLSADLIRQRAAVIAVAGGAVSVLAAKAATSTIPIVFIMGDDPIRSGLVASLNRPGGNVTGVSLFVRCRRWVGRN